MKPKTGFYRSFEKKEYNNRPQVHYSLAELRALVAQENSCVTCVSCMRSVDLTPIHLKDLKASVKEKLSTRVTKFDAELGGVVLAHKNIKIITSSIRLSDNRLFPVGYVADVFIFTPTVGKILTGVVNKISATDNMYSVLVHNLFNVAVHTDHPLPLTLGSTASVQVSFVDFTGRLLYIRAKYCHPEGTECNENQSNVDTPDAIGDISVQTKEKKKKKKKSTNEEPAEPSQPRELHSILKNSPAPSSASSLEPSASSESEPTAANNSVENIDKFKKIKLKKAKHKSKNSPEKEPELKRDVALSKKRKRTSESTDDSDVFLTPPPWLDEKRKKKKLNNNSPAKSITTADQTVEPILAAPSSTPLNGDHKKQTDFLLKDQLASIKQELANRQDEVDKSVAKIVTKMEQSQSEEVPKRKRKRERKASESSKEQVEDITKQMIEQALSNIKGE
ncbi:Twist neighbor [Nesidiocoris tenuis]|uniref:Twist neighbor n=1 Tax=Nesidiocoris tenuis TaxID=355587 RepID=A0ABN7B7R6_9HEMI|nr:Twist neighbor [Nesidiocoris tenuis]